MPTKTTTRSTEEQREQLDRVIAAKLPEQSSTRTRTKPANTPKRTQTSRP